jgi:hypothetical protein
VSESSRGVLSRSFSLAFEYYKKKAFKNNDEMARDDGGENFGFSAGRVWNFKFRYNKIKDP